MQEKLDSFFNYIQYEKRYSKHTISAYSKDLEHVQRYLLDTYGLDQVGAIEFFHLRSWVIFLMEEGLTPRSIHRKMASLKSFFKYLLRENIIKNNPASKLIAPKVGKRLPEYADEKQMEQLLEGITFPEGYIGSRDKTILELFYATGIRKAELIGLNIRDIDFTGLTIIVLGKRNKQRIVPISKEMGTMLSEYIHERDNAFPEVGEDTLFLTKGGKVLYPKIVYNIVKKYLGSVTTTEKKGPHTLRHTFATHLSNRGADLNAIKELLGHSSLAATQVYVHNSIERLKKIYENAHPKGKDTLE